MREKYAPETIEPIKPLSTRGKKKVAAYARVSMETDALLHSLAALVDYYTRKIRANPEWEYAGVYADEGISGTSTEKRKQSYPSNVFLYGIKF